MQSTKVRETKEYIIGTEAELNTSVFFRIRLPRDRVDVLVRLLDACTTMDAPGWFVLTATQEDPARWRLTKSLRVPKYEQNATQTYLRVDAVRINGGAGSCNIEFSGAFGAGLLGDRLRAAREQMRQFVDIRIPNRKRPLIEFIPDVEMASSDADESERFGASGEASAASVLPVEDFSDWEDAHG